MELGEEVLLFLSSDKNVKDVEWEVEDTVGDFCYILTFEKNLGALDKIETLKFKLNKKFNLYIYCLYDQIADQLLDDGDEVCIDFYCFKDKKDFLLMY